MVNEVNKPPITTPENAQLEERLANSNRQLHAMQEEHRQLLEEMQMLRQRAAELSQRNAEQHITEEVSHEECETTVEDSLASASKTEEPNVSVPTESNAAPETSKNEEEQDDPETAAYLSQKLTEVAALKARLKKVQNIIDTTNLIENHVTKRSNEIAIENIAKAAASPIVANTAAVTSQFEERNEELLANMMNALSNFSTNMHNHPENDNDASTCPPRGDGESIPDENQELLSTMLTMFTDFTSDLRQQADGLRAERERIKVLKEELLRRKRGGN